MPAERTPIIDFKPDSPEGPPKEFRFTPAQVKSEMSKAGYTVTAEHDFLPRQHFLIFAIDAHLLPVGANQMLPELSPRLKTSLSSVTDNSSP